MSRRSVRWGADIGYQSAIKTFKSKESLRKHGLKGKLSEGDLGFSRGRTRKIAQEDAEDAAPASDAMTEDQWSEREQEIAERAGGVRRGLETWMSGTAASVRNFIQDCTPADIHPAHLRE